MNESIKETDRKARGVIESITHASWEAANGSHESAITLMDAFVPKGPDDGPRIPITHELMQAPTLTSRERLALAIGKHLFGDFNRNFGWDSNVPLNWENEHVIKFFARTSKTINGLVNQSGQFGQAVVENMAGANDAYHKLVDWAEAKLMSAR